MEILQKTQYAVGQIMSYEQATIITLYIGKHKNVAFKKIEMINNKKNKLESSEQLPRL